MKLRNRSTWWRRAMRAGGFVLFNHAEANNRIDVDRNGERWLARSLLSSHADSGVKRPFVAIDGGANAGAYTQMLLLEAQTARCEIVVHAFEPSPRAAAELRRKFANEGRVHVVEAGLAENDGRGQLFAGESGSTQASLVAREVLTGAAAVDVPLVTLESYLQTSGLTHVDLLKLDVEGYELAALRGLGQQLRGEVIDVIQFEYGGTTLDAGTSLRAIYACLEERGYSVAKLFPDALELRSYMPWMEHYSYANYAALSRRWVPNGRSSE